MRDYKLNIVKISGREKINIKLQYQKVKYMDSYFNIGEERIAKKQADMVIIKNNLPYKTQILKPLL